MPARGLRELTGGGQDLEQPRRQRATHAAADVVNYQPRARDAAVHTGALGQLAVVEPAEEVHPRDDPPPARERHEHEARVPLHEQPLYLVDGRVGPHLRHAGPHHGGHRPVGQPAGHGSIQNLPRHDADQCAPLLHRHRVDPQAHHSLLGLDHRDVVGARVQVGGGQARRGPVCPDHRRDLAQQLLRDLHRAPPAQAGRGGRRVPATAEGSEQLARVDAGEGGARDHDELRWHLEEGDHDRQVEDLRVAVDDVGSLLDLFARASDRHDHPHPAHLVLNRALDELVQQLELLGLQRAQDVAAHPLEPRPRFQKPRGSSDVGRRGVEVGQAPGVLVDPREA